MGISTDYVRLLLTPCNALIYDSLWKYHLDIATYMKEEGPSHIGYVRHPTAAMTGFVFLF